MVLVKKECVELLGARSRSPFSGACHPNPRRTPDHGDKPADGTPRSSWGRDPPGDAILLVVGPSWTQGILERGVPLDMGPSVTVLAPGHDAIPSPGLPILRALLIRSI